MAQVQGIVTALTR